MAARAKQIADAVRDDLIAGLLAGQLTPTFVCTSEYAPFRSNQQLTELTVICFPFTRTLSAHTRGLLEAKHHVGIFVSMALAQNSTVEALAAFCAPLIDQISRRLFGTVHSSANCISVQCEPLYEHERLRTDHIFESIIGLEFRENEDRND